MEQIQRLYCKHCGYAEEEGTAAIPYCPDCDERLQLLRYLPSEREQAMEIIEKIRNKNERNRQ